MILICLLMFTEPIMPEVKMWKEPTSPVSYKQMHTYNEILLCTKGTEILHILPHGYTLEYISVQ